MPLAAGSLDRRVAFKRALFTENGRNERVPAGEELVFECWCSREPVRDGERNVGRQVEREVSDRLVTRWMPELEALDLTEFAVCEGVTYDLVGRKEIGRREGFEWSLRARPGIAPE